MIAIFVIPILLLIGCVYLFSFLLGTVALITTLTGLTFIGQTLFAPHTTMDDAWKTIWIIVGMLTPIGILIRVIGIACIHHYLKKDEI